MKRIRNFIKAMKYQMPLNRFIKNLTLYDGDYELFSKYSHINKYTNRVKGMYVSYNGALYAARRMELETNTPLKVYKCSFCDGYHIGRQNSLRH